MSTYLVAFIVGELEATDAALVGRAPVRVWCVPGKRRLAAVRPSRSLRCASSRTTTACRIRATSSIFWRSRTLPPGPWRTWARSRSARRRSWWTSAPPRTRARADRRRRRPRECAHVVRRSRHDDLVERDLAQRGVCHLHGDPGGRRLEARWQRWTTFGVSRAAALSVDGLHSTRPIEFHVEAPRDADAMFDVLTYERARRCSGCSSSFSARRSSATACVSTSGATPTPTPTPATSGSRARRAARQPIPEVMDGWIFQPGYPLVSARLEGDQLVLSQQRFTYLPDALPGSTPAPRDQLWQVPVQVRVTSGGRPSTERACSRRPRRARRCPARRECSSTRAVTGSIACAGDELLQRLLGALPELAAIERFNLVNDAWAVTVAGLMALPDYLELTARFRGERDRNVWSVLLASFATINRISDAGHRPRLARSSATASGPSSPRRRARRGRADAAAPRRLVRALGVLGDDRASRRKRPSCTRRGPISIPTCFRPSSACSRTRATPRATTTS